jgi:uncharacterized phiE125 gp8 family phage protein
MTLDDFPLVGDRTIYLPVGPVQQVLGITYLDLNGVTQTLASSKYRVDLDSVLGRISEEFNSYWPNARWVLNSVAVSFKCGYGDAGSSVPEDLRGAILLLVGHYYANREAVVGGTTSQVLMGVEELLELYSLRP